MPGLLCIVLVLQRILPLTVGSFDKFYIMMPGIYFDILAIVQEQLVSSGFLPAIKDVINGILIEVGKLGY
jgi:hypothetical protein